MKTKKDTISLEKLSKILNDELVKLREKKKNINLDKIEWNKIYRALLYQSGIDTPKPKLEELFEFRSSEMFKIVNVQKQMSISSFYGIFIGILTNITVDLFFQNSRHWVTALFVAVIATIVFLVLYSKIIIEPFERKFKYEFERYAQSTSPIVELIQNGFTMDEIINECLKRVESDKDK